jgi:hypothetical protein
VNQLKIFMVTQEKDYNKFYELITNENKIQISLEERELIIITIISLHLRNLYWFRVINNFWADLIKRFDNSNPVDIYNEDDKILFPFEMKSVDEIILDHKKENKQVFIREHLRLTLNLIKSHLNDIIFVDKNQSNTAFITSDRPVICDNIAGSFRLPINKDYFLTIMPNKEKIDYDLRNIIRNDPFIDARIFNIMQYENAERFIIGYNLNEIRLARADYEIAIKSNR